MNEITKTSSTMMPLPAPRCEITIRQATRDDVPFMDELQKKHNKQLGYFPTKQFEGYVEMGAVLVAEGKREDLKHEDLKQAASSFMSSSFNERLGYVIARDRYLKRDELGVIYQLCVVPGEQRKLVGASLIKAVFERSAYGCRLYCCWCAQDIAANYFWEGLGFVPVAFRAGSTGKKRVHIFWQKRICEGDEVTPYWYPFQTNSGAIREDRLVFPIPPGTHWKEVQAVAVPARVAQPPALPAERTAVARAKPKKPTTVIVGGIAMPGLKLNVPSGPSTAPPATAEKKPAPRKARAEKGKIDPKYLTAARELRDRYMEQINSDARALPACGKYDVARLLPAPVKGEHGQVAHATLALPAAA